MIWDLLKGQLRLCIEPGKHSDSTTSLLEEMPPAGSLSIFDLGYFSLERFRQWGIKAFWISRGITKLTIFVGGKPYKLIDWLSMQISSGSVDGPVDTWVQVGRKERLDCRLVALRAPKEVADRRKRKAREKAAKKGRQPTCQHLQACEWTVFLTNCPEDMVTWKEVVVLYRVRWQIELLFKLWKSHNRLATPSTT